MYSCFCISFQSPSFKIFKQAVFIIQSIQRCQIKKRYPGDRQFYFFDPEKRCSNLSRALAIQPETWIKYREGFPPKKWPTWPNMYFMRFPSYPGDLVASRELGELAAQMFSIV